MAYHYELEHLEERPTAVDIAEAQTAYEDGLFAARALALAGTAAEERHNLEIFLARRVLRAKGQLDPSLCRGDLKKSVTVAIAWGELDGFRGITSPDLGSQTEEIRL